MERTFRPAPSADLYIANRYILTLRSEVLGNPPEHRIDGIHKRLDEALARNCVCELRDSVMFSGRAILLDGRPLMYVAPLDIDPTLGEELDSTVDHTLARLRRSIAELKELRDERAMAINLGIAVLYTLLLVVVVKLLHRARNWLRIKATSLVQQGIERTGVKGLLSRNHTAVLVAQRLAVGIIGVLVITAAYFWLTAVLDRIPVTRAWSERLLGMLVGAGIWMLDAVLEAIPGLAVVAVIVLITRWIAQLLSTFFDRVQRGSIEVAWLDASIAQPTRRVFVLLLWLFALVIAYPYIPGSSTKAFQGVGVLAGVMLSLGSSGVISQAMSGLALMFNRLMRVGECVAVGDVVTGVVKQIGYFNTTFTTSYGEEVTVPNSVIIASRVTNLSRHTGKGILWTTGVTIGYDSPWRQVHAMLLEAARMTTGLASDPAPKVAQHALNDFYVDYRLTVVVQAPFRQTLSDLHANIQDVFNANGVQIMSPHYMADPPQAKVVPGSGRDPGVRPVVP